MRLRRILFSVLAAAVFVFACACQQKEYHEAKRIILVSSGASTEAVTSRTTSVSSAEKSTVSGDKSMTVYYTKTGKRYHYSETCGGGEMMSCTLQEALDMGLTPCHKCAE